MALSNLSNDLQYISDSTGYPINAGSVGNNYDNALFGAVDAMNYYGAKYALAVCSYTLTPDQTYDLQTVYVAGNPDYPGPLVIPLGKLSAGSNPIYMNVTALIPLDNGSIYCYRSNPGGAVYVPVHVNIFGYTRNNGKVYG